MTSRTGAPKPRHKGRRASPSGPKRRGAPPQARSASRSGQGSAPPRESAAARADRARAIAARLATRYPRAEIPLRHRNRLELLIATILSAQCTDAQVNRVTPALFDRWRTAADYAGARPADLEAMIRSTGFFHAKARSIQGMCRALLERHGGEVPDTMEELVALPGVGRKTANVILGASGVPGVVVDTHVRRLARRLALTGHDDPVKIEQDIEVLLPPKEWSAFSLRLIYFGREICTAQRPLCPECPLNDLCPSARYLGAPPWMKRAAHSRAATTDGPKKRTAHSPAATTDGRMGHHEIEA